MPPAEPDGTACDFDRSRLPASRAAVFGESADVGNKRLDWKSQISSSINHEPRCPGGWRGLFMCAEHVRQRGGESPLDNLMEVKS